MVFCSTLGGIPGAPGFSGTASHEPWYAPWHFAMRGLSVCACYSDGLHVGFCACGCESDLVCFEACE